jgi:Fic family protein
MAGWDAKRPYNALPELPPAADLETRAVLKRCVEARAALEGLRRSTQLIPNPGMLVSTLPVLEAQASSEIENVVTTADALFQHLHNGGSSDPATREALRYREALLEGFRELKRRPVSTRLAESICTTIKGVEMEVRRVPGTALQPSSSGKVVYTPPETESRLRDLMANWERFVHADDALDPLVRLAAAHYQFEAIHPFTDGNGRTGRVLNSLMLVERGLLDAPVLYLSRYIIRHKTEYYGRLLAVTRDAEWEPWVLYLLEAVEDTARWTTHKIDAIRALEVETARRLRERLPKIHSRELVELLFTQPYCRIANLVAAGIAGRQAAARYLKALVDAGVLKEKPVGREKLFVHSRLLELLTRDGKATASPARRGTRQT